MNAKDSLVANTCLRVVPDTLVDPLDWVVLEFQSSNTTKAVFDSHHRGARAADHLVSILGHDLSRARRRKPLSRPLETQVSILEHDRSRARHIVQDDGTVKNA